MNLNNRKQKIIILGLIALLLLLALAIYLLGNRPENTTPSEPRPPEIVKEEIKEVIEITEIPRVDEEQGGGIDEESPEIKLSKLSLSKLDTVLPFFKIFTSADGIEVEVSIPPTDTVSNDWTLLVHIFGPDYQIPEDDPEYETMKKAFLEGVDVTLQFLTENEIEPSEIIIQWGDRAIIGDRSATWLNE